MRKRVCGVCGNPLPATYAIDLRGTPFCRHHAGDCSFCRFCGRIVLARGQAVCEHCGTSAVTTAAQARPIFAALVEWVNRQGLWYNNLDLRIELRSRRQLLELLTVKPVQETLGATRTTVALEGNVVVGAEVESVVILRGLPSTLFEGVTVHELGHAWLSVHRIVELPLWASEGFCELLAYRRYRTVDSAEARHHAALLASNRDPIYGYGFRRLNAIAGATDFRSLVDALRTTKRLPVPNKK